MGDLPRSTTSWTAVGGMARFMLRGADERLGAGVDLDDEVLGESQLRRQRVGHHRAQLDDRVVALALDAPRPHDHPCLVQLEVGRVEEEDLADLRLERVEREGAYGRDLGAVREW